jgi:hypothetical protein
MILWCLYYLFFDPLDILDVIDLLLFYDLFEESGYFE